MEAVVIQLLGVIAQIAPGVLKAMTGAQTDQQAIERARDAYRAIPSRPAGSAIDAHERGEKP
jgi:hypothetical protein